MEDELKAFAKYVIKQMQLISTCRTFKLLTEKRRDDVPADVVACCDELNTICDELDSLMDGFKKEWDKEVKKNG